MPAKSCGTVHAVRLVVALALAVAIKPVARAQTEADFYRGKTVMVGVPSDPGAGYDLHARLFANYLPKYIPGNPAVVTQYITAGAGMVLANNLFNTSPRDGTAIALLRASVLYEEIFGANTAVRFRGREFTWLGNLNSSQDTCVFPARGGANGPDDFFTREFIMGADGVAGMDYSFPQVYNRFLGARFRIVTGYKGTPDRVLAIERGEIEGVCGVTSSQVKATLIEAVKAGRLKIVAQAGLTSDPDLGDVPNMLDRAKTPEQRRALEFLFAQLKINRSVAAPPGLPPERAATLRRAFDAVAADPAFLAEAKRQRVDMQPTGWAETAAAIEGFYNSPREVVDLVRAALAPEGNR